MASPVRWSLAHPLWALGSHRGIAAVTDGAGGGGGEGCVFCHDQIWVLK